MFCTTAVCPSSFQKVCYSSDAFSCWSVLLLLMPSHLFPTTNMECHLEYISLSFFRRILPDGFLGIVVTNSAPPAKYLCPDTFPAINFLTSSSVSFGPFDTMKALGTSPDLWSGTPMTAASATPGWLRSMSSSSAGATYKECNNWLVIFWDKCICGQKNIWFSGFT